MATPISRRRQISVAEGVESGVNARPVSKDYEQFFSMDSIRQPSRLGRPRSNTLEEIRLSDGDKEALRSRFYRNRHRDSVRGNLIAENRRLNQVWKAINQIGNCRKDYSLFLFHRNGRFRRNVKKIAKSRLFKFLMAMVVLLHFVALCLYEPAINMDIPRANKIIYYVTMVVVVLYIIEAGLTIIAYSFIYSKKAYLRKAENILDIFVIIMGILYIAVWNTTSLFGEIFASFMVFKLIKLIALSESVRFILKALAKSVYPLFYLAILTFMVITFLSLIGIQLFQGVLHRGCFANHSLPSGHNQSVLVSEFPCGNDSHPGSHSCPYQSICTNWPEGPKRGVISFDNMGFAYLTVFQVISLEGWITVLYLYESALGYAWVWFYFIVVMFFGSIFILNLWTGVLTSVFIGVSDREEQSGRSRQMKEDKKITKDLQHYNDWLRIAAEMDTPSDTSSIIDRNLDQKKRSCSREKKKDQLKLIV